MMPELEVAEVPWDADGLDKVDEAQRPSWAPKNLSGRHLVMLEYHLAGFTNKEIAQELGMTEVRIGQVIRSPAAQAWIEGRIGDMNAELQGQFHKVVRNLSEALNHESVDVRLKANDMWLKAHGRYAPKKAEGENRMTVEDVITRLLNGTKKVEVNIDNRQIHMSEPPASRDSFAFLGPPDDSA